MAERALPDLKSRLIIDTTSLPEAEAKAKAMSGSLASGLGEAEKAAGGLESGLKNSSKAMKDTETQSSGLLGKLGSLGGLLGGSGKQAEEFEKAMGGAKELTGEFAEPAENLISKLGALQGLAGFGGMGAAVLGATAALGIGLEVVKSSVETYAELAERVLNFQRVTGASAEESSRLVDVFGQLGIDADTAANAMFRLNKQVDGADIGAAKTGKTLEQLGVQVARNADGSADLEKTLFNVADAYKEAGSQADKDAIAFAAFGRSGATLIPVLEQGSSGLTALAAASRLAFSQEQLEQVHQYGVELQQLHQDINVLQVDLGSALLPQVSNVARGTDLLTVTFQNLAKGMPVSEAIAMAHADQVQADAASRARDQVTQLTQSLKEQEDAQNALYTADQSLISATVAKERADQSVLSAQKALADETLKDSEYNDKHTASVHAIGAAQDKLTQAVKRYGPTSDQVASAQDALNRQIDAGRQLDQQYADQASTLARYQLDLKDSMVSAANAAVALAEKQADAAGSSLTAADKANIFRQALQNEMQQLAPDSPLRTALQGYIDQLANIPSTINTTLTLTTAAATTGYQNPGRQSGGSVLPGRAYEVGEVAQETLYMYPGGGGYVVPHTGGRRGGDTSSGPSITNHFHGVASDPSTLAAMVAGEQAWQVKIG